MIDPNRREFLAAAAAGLAALDPVAAAAARNTRKHRRKRRKHAPTGLAQVEHVVILMQENVSFDHYFGTLRGVRGFGDPAAITLPNGQSVFQQPYPLELLGGYLLPWHLDTTSGNPCSPLVSNGWPAMHAALDGGKMDGWGSAAGPSPDPMAYYTRADVPWHMALADAFTVCDGYYCSVLGPTNPNRLYSMTGTINAAGGAGGPVTDNSETPPYTWTTYPERLQAKGVSWRIYQQTDNFDDNALAWFKVFQQSKPGSPLYENGIRARPASAFADDLAAGRLPQVSWVLSPTAQSEHPGYAPGGGADFLNGILGALFAHPSVWAKTVVIVTYDENGGYFDHVRPPLPPAGAADEWVGGQPIGLGFRVPTVICSPWSRGGYVCSRTFDHTSTIRFLERRFGVREPNISAWRRATCGDLTATLDFRHRDLTIPSLPATGPLAGASARECANNVFALPPLVGQQLPVVEPGPRRRRG